MATDTDCSPFDAQCTQRCGRKSLPVWTTDGDKQQKLTKGWPVTCRSLISLRAYRGRQQLLKKQRLPEKKPDDSRVWDAFFFVGDHKGTTSAEGTGPDDATLRLLQVHCGWSCSKRPGVVVSAKMSHTLASNDGRRDFDMLPLGCQAGCGTHHWGCSLPSFFLLIRNGNKQAEKEKGFEVIMIRRRLQIIHPSIFILLICNRVAGPAGLARYSMFRSSQQWFPTFPAERTPGTSWPFWQVLDLPWGLCTSRRNTFKGPGGIPDQIPETPQFAPLHSKKQQLYSKLLILLLRKTLVKQSIFVLSQREANAAGRTNLITLRFC